MIHQLAETLLIGGPVLLQGGLEGQSLLQIRGDSNHPLGLLLCGGGSSRLGGRYGCRGSRLLGDWLRGCCGPDLGIGLYFPAPEEGGDLPSPLTGDGFEGCPLSIRRSASNNWAGV